jgi:hypothetical protein
MKLLGGTALMPGNTTRLLVEWDTPLEAEGLEYTLRANEQNGARAVSVALDPLSASPLTAPAKEKKP